jgi:hypothetical protein
LARAGHLRAFCLSCLLFPGRVRTGAKWRDGVLRTLIRCGYCSCAGKIQACASSRVARSGSYPEPLCNPFQTWPAHFNDFPYLRPATLCWLSRIEESNARFPQFEGARGSGLAEARAHSPRPGWSSLDNEPAPFARCRFRPTPRRRKRRHSRSTSVGRTGPDRQARM